MGQGWISIHRQIQENWVWQDKPFSQGQAWIDLLLMANHSENKFALGNEIITVEAGSFITSELKLMERWGWSKTKVRRFLTLLTSDGMITKKSDCKKTTINIVNYRVFQNFETTEEPIKDHKKTTDRPKKDTNNNVNNENNKNNIISISIQEVARTYEQEISTVSSYVSTCIAGWLDVVDAEVIIHAIKTASANNKKSWSYVDGILRNNLNNGRTTLAAVKAAEEEFKTKKGTPKNGTCNRQHSKQAQPKNEYEAAGIL